MKRGCICILGSFLILLIALTSVGFAEESVFYKGEVDFKVNEIYKAGDTINSTITISNLENFPIADSTLVAELVKGCSEPVYPSQASDCDNVIDEKIISEINLAPKSNKKIELLYQLPKDLATGTYRLDIYFVARKAPIIGIPSIFLPGVYKSFKVEGLSAEKETKTIRTKTNIKGEIGPIGVGVDKNENIVLEVYASSSSQESAQLSMKLCDWEDTTCNSYLVEKTLPINLNQGENKFNLEFQAPSKTSAYPIRIEIKKDGKILSLYRSRIVVKGESAKIRKLYPDKILYGNEEAKISVLVGPSPDHYTNPTTKNVLLNTKLINFDGKIYEKSETISEISSKDFLKKEFTIKVKELKDYEICAELKSGDEVYDSECYKVIASKFLSSQHLIELEQAIFQDDTFIGNICVKDSLTKLPIKTDASIIVMKNNSAMLIEQRKIDGCTTLTLEIQLGTKYELKVYDLETNQEFKFDIYKKSEKQKIPIVEKERLIELGKNYWILGIILLVVLIIIVIIILIIKKRKKENGY